MSLNKEIRKLIEKYSFVKRTELRNGTIHIVYDFDGKEKSKALPYRANKSQLIAKIERIKKDIGFYEEKKLRDELVRKELNKPMMFVNK